MAEAKTPQKLSCQSDELYFEAENVLKEHCESLWEEVKEAQETLLNATVRQQRITSHEPLAISINLAKKRQLTAEIAVTKTTHPRQLPVNDVLEFEVVRADLEKSINSLQDTLILAECEQKELETEIRSEEQFKIEVEQIKNVLQKKMAETLSLQEASENSNVIKSMVEREKALKRHFSMLMKRVSEFVEKHFPNPTDSQVDKWKKEHSDLCGEFSFNGVQFLPLLSILQLLLDRCLYSTHNAYISLDNTFWPPYVELLIRMGIALRNPDNPQEIRLTPYHL